jgi:hypothetical protein
MGDYQAYSDIKNLINEYWELKDQAKYDEFVRRLCDILRT